MRFLQFCLTAFLFSACDGWNRAPDTNGGFYNPHVPPSLDQLQGLHDRQNPSAPSSQDTCRTRKPIDWGVLKCHEDQIKLFNDQLRNFLSASMDPRNLGAVDCSNRKDLKGGAFIRGNVEFENGELFNPCSLNQNMEVSENSYLDFHAVGIGGRSVAQLHMKAIPYAGTVRGSTVTLAFSLPRSRGKVFLRGLVENGVYSGDFVFENSTSYQGSAYGQRGRLGKFSIYACSLLSCVD